MEWKLLQQALNLAAWYLSSYWAAALESDIFF
jgi:hypothetical protein